MRIGTMDHDLDYEATQTQYVTTAKGDYELIERNDLHVRGPRDSEQSNLKFFDSDIDRRMKSHVNNVEVIHEVPEHRVVTKEVKEVIVHTKDNRL